MEFDDKNNIIIYQDDNGVPKVNVRFADTDVWLTQQLQVATRFRRWATERLHEYIQKVFAIDDECNFLKTILTKIASVPPMPHQPHHPLPSLESSTTVLSALEVGASANTVSTNHFPDRE